MPETPFFPAWRGRFQRPGAGLPATLAGLRRCTLDKLEDRFGPLLAGITALSPAHASARERPFSVRRTWWCFLWQMLQADVSCRSVVRQLQALLVLEGRRTVQAGTGAYCQARARLPEPVLRAALAASAQAAAHRVAPLAALQGRVVKVLDGTVLTLPDTPANQAAYPQPSSQRPGCGFPLLHLLVVWSARGGAVLDHARGNHHHSELRLLHQLWPALAPQDIVIYDRAAGNYVACAQVQAHGADLISRVAVRKIDWRRGRRLGPAERLVVWRKTRQQPPYLTPQEWAALPELLSVRVIRVRVRQKGFRTRTLALVTTLLDAAAYPAAEIAAAYLRRWRLEMCLDDLKTTLGLDALRCRSPALVHRELLTLLIAHNLVRAVMAEAAQTHAVPLDRVSFKGTLDTLRSCCGACAQAPRALHRRLLWAAMLCALAADLLPLRPDRWEPRVVKLRPKAYPRLTHPRHLYRELRHGTRYRRPAQT
jgi:Transposase DDE domain